MSEDTQKKLQDMASNYLDLWQKQLTSQAAEKASADLMKTASTFGAGFGEMMQNFDTPEKSQAWMSKWADSWKAQFGDGSEQSAEFAKNVAKFQEFVQAQAATHGANPDAASSGDTEHNVDELTRRIALLEERIHTLESKLKD